MKTEIDFNIVPITAKNKNSVLDNFSLNFFLQHEPLHATLEMFEDNEIVTGFKHFFNKLLDNEMAFMAVSQAGDIMGTILNSRKSKNDSKKDTHFDDKFYENKNFKKLSGLFDIIRKKADVFSKYPNVEHILEINIITVNDAYREQGVCKALVNKTKEFAREKGYQMIYVECTSHYSAKAVEKFGFQRIYSLPYVDYVDEDGEIVFKTHTPHKNVNIYVLPL